MGKTAKRLMVWNSWKSTFLLSTRWGWQRLLACCHDGRPKRNLLNINYHPGGTTLSPRPGQSGFPLIERVLSSHRRSICKWRKISGIRVRSNRQFDTLVRTFLSFFTGQFDRLAFPQEWRHVNSPSAKIFLGLMILTLMAWLICAQLIFS